jgi:hypothetical protein
MDSSITSACCTLVHIIVRTIHIENIYIVVEYQTYFVQGLKTGGNVRFIKHLSSVLILKIMFKHNIHMKFLSPLLSELLDMLRKWTDQRKTWKKKSRLTKNCHISNNAIFN